jgi:hypothetical protein
MDRSGTFQKKRRKEWKKEKEEIYSYLFFTFVEVPILVCSPSVGNGLGLLPLCNPPSGEPTPTGTSPTTCHPSQQLLVILPSNPLSSLGGKKI